MFEKNLKMAYLLDFYSEVLDEHTRNIMRAYYNDDLSLSEIADDEGISRQGIRHVIKRGEEQLQNLESRLGLATHYEELRDAVQLLEEVALHSREEDKESIRRVIEIILNKN